MRPPFALEYSALTSLCCYFVNTPSATVLVPYQLWLEPTLKKNRRHYALFFFLSWVLQTHFNHCTGHGCLALLGIDNSS